MATTAESIELDSMDIKLTQAFPGRVVRKDLVRNIKGGFNVPVYVLEYLLGKYCSTTDPQIIAEGLELTRQTLAQNFVRADESEKIKSITRERGTHKIIDKVRVRLLETEDKYWAELVNMGLGYVHVSERDVRQYDKLLGGGIWAIIDLRYDPEFQHRGQIRPFIIEQMKPIQQASTDIQSYRESRKLFSRDEWIDVLLRSIGIEPNNSDFTHRKKLLLLSRLIPLVESNFNLIELGPRATGKSFIYREISPYSILLSGGQTTVAQLFMNLSTGQVGLVGLWDTVAFDEVAGIRFKDTAAIQILKDYMESGSFSRGKEEIPAGASIVFNGNIDGDVHALVKTTHLLSSLPEQMQDLALIDRIHFYLPGWEVDKLRPEYLSMHYGFIVDYFSEVLREARKVSLTDVVDRYFRFGSHLNQRDARAVRKTVSGLVKLLHPDGIVTKDEVEEYLTFALEMRRRVKEQLRKMGGFEYWAVNFSYIDIETMNESFVAVLEEGGGGLIVAEPMRPGVVYTIATDPSEARLALVRIEIQSMPGSGGLRVTGAPKGNSPMKDAIHTAYDYIRAHIRNLSPNKSLKDYDLHVQVVNLMQAKEGSETGVAFFIAMLSALIEKPAQDRLVILGEMSIHGSLLKVDKLSERLQLAMDQGARKVLLPGENKRDIADIPTEVLDKLQISFYSDPTNAAFRAMGME
jgi:ATP-dependent Lon protease